MNLLAASVYLTMPGNDTVAVFSAVNLIICLFNALPIGYFDGAGILEILLSKFLSLRVAEKVKRVIGVMLSVVMIGRYHVLHQLQQKRFVIAHFCCILSDACAVYRVGLAISGFM